MLHGFLPDIMGTRLDAVVIGNEAATLSVWGEAVAETERLHRMLNRFDRESEIAHVNRNAAAGPVAVSEEFRNILTDIKRYHRDTLGYFDITLHDFVKVIADDSRTVAFADETVSLDLGGYAKGYALNAIRDIFLRSGVGQALVNFGNSSVLALGTHPHGDCWKVGLDDPFSPERQLKVFELRDTSLSTSGNTPRHTNHIVNPHSGEFAPEHKVVSVISADCVEAEILSTALMIADESDVETIEKVFPKAICYIFAPKKTL